MYVPEKYRFTSIDGWAEWLLDECGIEHDQERVLRLAMALRKFETNVIETTRALCELEKGWQK